MLTLPATVLFEKKKSNSVLNVPLIIICHLYTGFSCAELFSNIDRSGAECRNSFIQDVFFGKVRHFILIYLESKTNFWSCWFYLIECRQWLSCIFCRTFLLKDTIFVALFYIFLKATARQQVIFQGNISTIIISEPFTFNVNLQTLCLWRTKSFQTLLRLPE